jgi:hypothetical protein
MHSSFRAVNDRPKYAGESMATFDQLRDEYDRRAVPANIGDTVEGVRLGELDADVQDVLDNWDLGPVLGLQRVARLGLGLATAECLLLAMEPGETRDYVAFLSEVASAALSWIAENGDPPAMRVIVSDADEAKVIRQLVSDVTATLGSGHETSIRETAARVREFQDDPVDYRQTVVDDVQQYFHDVFIDTTWPRCPLHSNHPLWLHDGHWICEKDRIVVARLGELRAESGRQR